MTNHPYVVLFSFVEIADGDESYWPDVVGIAPDLVSAVHLASDHHRQMEACEHGEDYDIAAFRVSRSVVVKGDDIQWPGGGGSVYPDGTAILHLPASEGAYMRYYLSPAPVMAPTVIS